MEVFAADIEFELAATERLYPVFAAVLDRPEERLHRAEPGRLDVEPLRFPAEVIDRSDAAGWVIPRDARFVTLEQRSRLVV